MSSLSAAEAAPTPTPNPIAPSALVRVQPPEERDYARCLIEIEMRRRRIAALRTELAELKAALARFADRVLRRASELFAELDRVRRDLREKRRRLAWLRADVDPDVPEEDDPPEPTSADQNGHGHGPDAERGGPFSRQRAATREFARPRLDPAGEARIRQVYRDLARRYHPDLARSDAERRSREDVMLRVNAAYQQRDLEALLTLQRQAEADAVSEVPFDASLLRVRLDFAYDELARLDAHIVALETELEVVRAGETHQLWQRHQSGEPVVAALEADIEQELSRRRKRLTTLTVACHRAQRRRQVRRAVSSG